MKISLSRGYTPLKYVMFAAAFIIVGFAGATASQLDLKQHTADIENANISVIYKSSETAPNHYRHILSCRVGECINI